MGVSVVVANIYLSRIAVTHAFYSNLINIASIFDSYHPATEVRVGVRLWI